MVGYEQGSFTILTTDVGDGIRDPHNRMPIILDERGVPALAPLRAAVTRGGHRHGHSFDAPDYVEPLVG